MGKKYSKKIVELGKKIIKYEHILASKEVEDNIKSEAKHKIEIIMSTLDVKEILELDNYISENFD